MQTLSSIPSDVFALISAYLDGHDLVSLIWTGDSALRHRVRRHGTDFRVRVSGFVSFPILALEFASLRTLAIKSACLAHFPLIAVPTCDYTSFKPLATLETLDLSFDCAMEFVMSLDAHLPRMFPQLRTLHITGDSLVDFEPLLRHNLPRELEALILCDQQTMNAPVRANSSILQQLPRTLTRLDAYPLEITRENEKDEISWPPNLRFLRLRNIWSAEPLNRLPAQLEIIECSVGDKTTISVSTWPKTLQKFDVSAADHTSTEIDIDAPFPPNLEFPSGLRDTIVDESQIARNGVQWLPFTTTRTLEAQLRLDLPNLQGLVVSEPVAADIWQNHFPQKLNWLVVNRNCSLSGAPITFPNTLESVSGWHFDAALMSKLPAGLTSLLCSYELVNKPVLESSLNLLPRSLVELEFNIYGEASIMYEMAAISNFVLLQTLWLQAIHPKLLAAANFFQCLPTTLKHLTLASNDDRTVTPVSIPSLPHIARLTRLETLTLNVFIKVHKEKPNNDIWTHLPPTLTNLRLEIPSGKLGRERPYLRRLPPKLHEFTLYCRDASSKVVWTNDDFAGLPKKLHAFTVHWWQAKTKLTVEVADVLPRALRTVVWKHEHKRAVFRSEEISDRFFAREQWKAHKHRPPE